MKVKAFRNPVVNPLEKKFRFVFCYILLINYQEIEKQITFHASLFCKANCSH